MSKYFRFVQYATISISTKAQAQPYFFRKYILESLIEIIIITL